MPEIYCCLRFSVICRTTPRARPPCGLSAGFPRLARFKGTTPCSHFPRAKALRKVEIFRAAALGLQFLRAFIYYFSCKPSPAFSPPLGNIPFTKISASRCLKFTVACDFPCHFTEPILRPSKSPFRRRNPTPWCSHRRCPPRCRPPKRLWRSPLCGLRAPWRSAPPPRSTRGCGR